VQQYTPAQENVSETKQ